MQKRSFFVNFCPKKMFWELQQIEAFRDLSGNWWDHPEIYKQMLLILKQHRISGLRLNIFNTEIYDKQHGLNFMPLDLMLDIAKELEMYVDLCMGPYQYPLWPGIRLPEELIQQNDKNLQIDQHKKWIAFGISLIENTLKKYGKNKQISGFYLGNEWHTSQSLENYSEKICYTVSSGHMKSLARTCKKLTKKPIIFNTNFDAHQVKEIQHLFTPLFAILKNQAQLGLDVYPSQESFAKAAKLWIHRKMFSFSKDVEKVQKTLIDQQLIFSEFEAQPWGNGQAWEKQISGKSINVDHQAQVFNESYQKYIVPTSITKVTFWGGEYWLIANQLGFNQPLLAVQNIAKY